MAGAGGKWIELGIVGLIGYAIYQQLVGGSVASPLDAVALAIQGHEGWAPGSVSFRNNNPGNLKYAGQAGATGADANGFAVFPTYDAGFQALKNQLALDASRNPAWTLTQFFTKYLGGNPYNPQVTGEGNPFTYAADVASKIGASVSDSIGKLFGVANG